ncbi:hypothetical protein Syun_031881 [Stephania yunnanensis]|uniref:Uncharacterized protein n=1 Tax=Stephania yunnanensis TaxID=152371 RepID=A0AAP0DWW6_9MAGN
MCACARKDVPGCGKAAMCQGAVCQGCAKVVPSVCCACAGGAKAVPRRCQGCQGARARHVQACAQGVRRVGACGAVPRRCCAGAGVLAKVLRAACEAVLACKDVPRMCKGVPGDVPRMCKGVLPLRARCALRVLRAACKACWRCKGVLCARVLCVQVRCKARGAARGRKGVLALLQGARRVQGVQGRKVVQVVACKRVQGCAKGGAKDVPRMCQGCAKAVPRRARSCQGGAKACKARACQGGAKVVQGACKAVLARACKACQGVPRRCQGCAKAVFLSLHTHSSYGVVFWVTRNCSIANVMAYSTLALIVVLVLFTCDVVTIVADVGSLAFPYAPCRGKADDCNGHVPPTLNCLVQ